MKIARQKHVQIAFESINRALIKDKTQANKNVLHAVNFSNSSQLQINLCSNCWKMFLFMNAKTVTYASHTQSTDPIRKKTDAKKTRQIITT